MIKGIGAAICAGAAVPFLPSLITGRVERFEVDDSLIWSFGDVCYKTDSPEDYALEKCDMVVTMVNHETRIIEIAEINSPYAIERLGTRYIRSK